MKITNSTYAVLGAGASGRAAAELLLAHGASAVDLIDAQLQSGAWLESLPAGMSVMTLDSEEVQSSYAGMVVSPGVDMESDWFKQVAALAQTPVIGELELAWSVRGDYLQPVATEGSHVPQYIAVTGTNGKTTTVELIAHILQGLGLRAQLCGNHGKPLSRCWLDYVNEPFEVAVIEVSSFQLETIETFAPEVAVCLAIEPDHLDRYKSYDDYEAAKLKIFDFQNKECRAIIDANIQLSSLAEIQTVSSSLEAHWKVKGEKVFYQGDLYIDVGDIDWAGGHQVLNLAYAIAALQEYIVDVSQAELLAILESFHVPAFRCQKVATIRGVAYYNDSKATNIDSVAKALHGLKVKESGSIIWIAGGKDKGLNYELLLPLVNAKVKQAFFIGEIGNQLVNLFEPVTAVENCQTLDIAVQRACQSAVENDIVLFSAGTSSFDQFSSYVERGEAFNDLLKNL